MGTRIPEDKIQEIRERTDIVEIVSSYLPLKRSGHNHLGLCPFHGEKTPSFNVNAARQIFHCFGCGVGGNVFTFLMRMEGLSFPEAARRLGERVGVEISEEVLSPAEEKRREEYDRLARINEVACDYYHAILLDAPEGAPARKYLRERGYDGETARRFRLGFAPDSWDGLARHLDRKGFDPHLAREELGLTREGKTGRGDYDLFRKRILFPILDLRGRVVAFGGRVLDDTLPKYINSPESPLYRKSAVLYGLAQGREAMRQTGEVIVVEGYFDLLALDRAGFRNVVATCGTALTEDHGRLLKRYAERVVLLFDQDKAGRTATFRGMDILLPQGLSVVSAALDAGDDPDSFLRKRGEGAFQQRLEGARSALEVFMDETLAACDGSVEGKAKAAGRIMESIRRMPGEIEKDLYLKMLSDRTGVAPELLARGTATAADRPSSPPPSRGGVRPSVRLARGGKSPAERNQEWLLRFMTVDSDAGREYRRRIEEAGIERLFGDENYQRVAVALMEFCGEETPADLNRLLDHLGEGEGAILSGILLREEKALEVESEAVFEGCLQAAFVERLKARSRELPLLIRKAEEAGDIEASRRLHAEQLEINKRLKPKSN